MWIAVAVGVVLLIVAVVQYNKLVSMRQLTRNAWADVDVFLKRRTELIPNLVAAVKGYAGYEQAALEVVAEARTKALASPGPSPQRVEAESDLTTGIVKVFAIAEAYPDLKASKSFINLQRELSDTETKIASARQYYNACVRDFNTMIEAFPSSVFASLGGFKHVEFFEVDSAADRVAPRAVL